MREPLAKVFCCALACAPLAPADVKPSALFSDHMVLQTGMSVPVWGSADAGEKVTVSIQGHTESTLADTTGKWIVRLGKLKVSDPLEMTIAGKNRIVVKDVLIGEVWFGAGQSNMEFPVSNKVAKYAGLVNQDMEIAAAKYPRIRMFTVKQSKNYEPRTELEANGWSARPKPCPVSPPSDISLRAI